jgi:hypothetical protein
MAGNSGKIRGADEELAFQAHYRHGYARADGYSADPYRRTPRKIVSEGHDSGRLNKRARIGSALFGASERYFTHPTEERPQVPDSYQIRRSIYAV